MRLRLQKLDLELDLQDKSQVINDLHAALREKDLIIQELETSYSDEKVITQELRSRCMTQENEIHALKLQVNANEEKLQEINQQKEILDVVVKDWEQYNLDLESTLQDINQQKEILDNLIKEWEQYGLDLESKLAESTRRLACSSGGMAKAISTLTASLVASGEDEMLMSAIQRTMKHVSAVPSYDLNRWFTSTREDGDFELEEAAARRVVPDDLLCGDHLHDISDRFAEFSSVVNDDQ